MTRSFWRRGFNEVTKTINSYKFFPLTITLAANWEMGMQFKKTIYTNITEEKVYYPILRVLAITVHEIYIFFYFMVHILHSS